MVEFVLDLLYFRAHKSVVTEQHALRINQSLVVVQMVPVVE